MGHGHQKEQSTWGTSSTLMERIRANDRQAWDALCEIYAPLVYSWARRSQLAEHDAEDVVQEVFRNVASSFKNFHYGPNSSFRGWLWTITRNVVCKWFRKLKGDGAQAEGGSHALQRINDLPDEPPAQEPALDVSEESALMSRAVKLVEQDFKPQTWKAFWQYAVVGRAASDVADEYGMSSQAVRQSKYRVLLRLREVLGSDWEI